MSNREIADQFKTMAALLEITAANPFQVRSYNTVAYSLEQLETDASTLSAEELESAGFTKGMADKIQETVASGSFAELNDLSNKVPEGVLRMLDIPGIGAKKIRILWQELKVEDTQALYEACQKGEVEKLKGFGQKTQQQIMEGIAYFKEMGDQQLYAQAEPFAEKLMEWLQGLEAVGRISFAGQYRRQLEAIAQLEFVCQAKDQQKVWEALSTEPELAYESQNSGPLSWRGRIKENGLKLQVTFAQEDQYAKQLFCLSAAPEHLAHPDKNGKSLYQHAIETAASQEEEIYQAAGLPFVPPALREGLAEFTMIEKERGFGGLLQMDDLKGVLHNHSTYSDGRHSLEEMATYCRDLGYSYLGMSDHSKSAFYANGLTEERIKEQHREIDELNKNLAPFRIFKGIESDILSDGRLDYADDVLASFDFIVASIHSGLKMDEAKATQRLITAIENPYTTMLGHPTGRLLLNRKGYPIDHKAVIDACADCGVVIEINANPLRLDLDWRWAHYALEKGVMLSINPDAHQQSGYAHMRFGVLVGQKAGLSPAMTFNALSCQEVANHFENRKKRALQGAKA